MNNKENTKQQKEIEKENNECQCEEKRNCECQNIKNSDPTEEIKKDQKSKKTEEECQCKNKKKEKTGIFKKDNKELEERMNKTISVLEENLAEVRAGRANPAILNKIKIDYYGVPTPINQVAGISVPEARMIMIQPWDASILKEIEKEILKSDIGINPNNDGKVIRLVFPELNEERRKELVKEIKKMGEESKIALRAIRRDGIDEAKAMEKESLISEDERRKAEEDIQKLTDKKTEEIDSKIAAKEKEIMSI